MTYRGKGLTHESRQSLYLLTLAPLIWAAHFLVCYVGAAVWIARFAGRDASLAPVRLAVAGLTVLALLGIGYVFRMGMNRRLYGTGAEPFDFDTPESRHRFLGIATVLLSLLSAVATLFTALAAVFIPYAH